MHLKKLLNAFDPLKQLSNSVELTNRINGSINSSQSNDKAFQGTTCSLNELINLQEMANALFIEHANRFPPGLSGDYLTSYRGHGMEYHESRLYQYGDDVKNMDWRVTARTQKPFVKTYRDERERPVFFLVDHTRSMHFATRNEYKSVKTSKVAALMAWTAVKNSDKVGGLVFDSTSHYELPPLPGERGVLNLLKKITINEPIDELHYSGEGASLLDSLHRLKFLIRKGSRVFIISDFNKVDNSFDEVFFELSRRGEINLIIVYDPIENQPLPQGRYRLSDGKQTLELDNINDKSRNTIKTLFEERMAFLDRLSKKYNMRVISVSTEKNLRNNINQELVNLY